MHLVIKIFIAVFILTIALGTAVFVYSDVEIPQKPVVKTVPNDSLVSE